MSNLEDYNQKLCQLAAIPADQIKSPSSIPVDIYIQEAENLRWGIADKFTILLKFKNLCGKLVIID